MKTSASLIFDFYLEFEENFRFSLILKFSKSATRDIFSADGSYNDDDDDLASTAFETLWTGCCWWNYPKGSVAVFPFLYCVLPILFVFPAAKA